jgi:hypothetical protein
MARAATTFENTEFDMTDNTRELKCPKCGNWPDRRFFDLVGCHQCKIAYTDGTFDEIDNDFVRESLAFFAACEWKAFKCEWEPPVGDDVEVAAAIASSPNVVRLQKSPATSLAHRRPAAAAPYNDDIPF